MSSNSRIGMYMLIDTKRGSMEVVPRREVWK